MQYRDLPKVVPILEQAFSRKKAPIVDFIAAQTGDPFKVLIATILSARTKDQTTTQVVKKLFNTVTDLASIRTISQKRLETLCHPVGFFRQKAKHIKQLPDVLETRFGGKIPRSLDELCQLPGVGRKTANLVMAVAFDQDAICVDVHVHRISNRFGLLATATPLETEMTLRKELPRNFWKCWNSLLVGFGQTQCTPTRPFCTTCPVAAYCIKANVKNPR